MTIAQEVRQERLLRQLHYLANQQRGLFIYLFFFFSSKVWLCGTAVREVIMKTGAGFISGVDSGSLYLGF